VPVTAKAKTAVFSRNHRQWLEDAVNIGARNPSAPIVFRSRARWATAARELARVQTLPIYFAPVGGTGKVEYVADLCDVLLDPIKGSAEARKWLTKVLQGTRAEQLWVPPANTLYEIRDCRKLKRPFQMTRLVKVSDAKPLSADYGYSYSIVERVANLA
jgi:hypothetical protein